VSGEVQVEYLENILLRKSGEVLEQAAQKNGGVTVPGGADVVLRNKV